MCSHLPEVGLNHQCCCFTDCQNISLEHVQHSSHIYTCIQTLRSSYCISIKLTFGSSGNALLPQTLQSRSKYLCASSTKKDTTGSIEGFSTNGGSLGLTFIGGTTQRRAISTDWAKNQRLNTGG